jgi:hypothetical protein
MRTTLGPYHSVDLVDDDRLHAGERLSRTRGKQQEERLGRGDEDVRRRPGKRPPVACRGVAGPDRDADIGHRHAESGCGVSDAHERRPEVALDVDRQGLQGRDVEHPAALRRQRRRCAAGQPVERPEERRQRLARTGRRDHQRVVTRADRRPGPRLGGGRRAERPPEPRRRCGGEAVEHVTCHEEPSLPPATDTLTGAAAYPSAPVPIDRSQPPLCRIPAGDPDSFLSSRPSDGCATLDGRAAEPVLDVHGGRVRPDVRRVPRP